MLWVLIGLIAVGFGFYTLTTGQILGGSAAQLAGKSAKGSKGGSFLNRLPAKPVGVLFILFGLFLMANTSFVYIGANQIGHLNRVYAIKNLPKDRIIALNGEKGPQARILGPGFHFIPLIRVLFDVEQYPVITVPDGSYGELTAIDGGPMPKEMFMAPAWPDDKVKDLEDAEKFLTKGGIRGPQQTVLKPGSYRLNRYLFKVKISDATKVTVVPRGHVGVVKSNVQTSGSNCNRKTINLGGSTNASRLTVPLVPKGCVGIWDEVLFPGAYYLNRQAYHVTFVSTMAHMLLYKGGYTKRLINLELDSQGNIKQDFTSEVHAVPKNAAAPAIRVKIEGWDIPLELRIQVQVLPKNAPAVIGGIGGLQQVEDIILTPAIRSIVRNVAGSEIEVRLTGDAKIPAEQPAAEQPEDAKETPTDQTGKRQQQAKTGFRKTRVLDLIDNRSSLERTMLAQLKIAGQKAGVEILAVRLGEPAIPPALLIARKRVQLASQLAKTYEEETKAQFKRIERDRVSAEANKQPELVAAQIAVKVAGQREAERDALGRGERKFLEELSRGQKAQATVLGEDRVAMLQALEKLLTTLERKPELVGLISRLVPHTVVGGADSSGLAGAAAIFGNAFSNSAKKKAP